MAVISPQGLIEECVQGKGPPPRGDPLSRPCSRLRGDLHSRMRSLLPQSAAEWVWLLRETKASQGVWASALRPPLPPWLPLWLPPSLRPLLCLPLSCFRTAASFS